MFDGLKKRLERLRAAPAAVLRAAAPLVEEKLRADATTRRGNVPSFGRMGNVPIRVEVRSGALAITGPDWVIEKAKEKDQPAEWRDIVRAEGHRVLGDGK